MFAYSWGCRFATYMVLRLHHMYILHTFWAACWQHTGFWGCIACLPTFRAADWQPTGFWACITCRILQFCLLLGLQVGNLQGLEAALHVCSAYFKGCRLATYRFLRLHYMYILPAFRAAGWQPTWFWGCVTCIFCLLFGLRVANLQGFEPALHVIFCSSACFWGCRLATYRVWRLHYMYVLLTLRAAGWQPTGFWGCITCIFCLLLGLQVGNLHGLEAAFTCIFCLRIGLQVGNLHVFDAALHVYLAYF